VIQVFRDVALAVLQLASAWDAQTGESLQRIAQLINQSVWDGLAAWQSGDSDGASGLLELALTNVHALLDQTGSRTLREK
jgi:hypothetical protein